jgi:hypothetical protein
MTIIDFELLAAQYKKAAEALWEICDFLTPSQSNAYDRDAAKLSIMRGGCDTLDEFIDNIWRHDDADDTPDNK